MQEAYDKLKIAIRIIIRKSDNFKIGNPQDNNSIEIVPDSNYQGQHINLPHDSHLQIKLFSNYSWLKFYNHNLTIISPERDSNREKINKESTFKYVEFLVYLKKLKGTTSTPTFFLCFTIINILQKQQAYQNKSFKEKGGGGGKE